MVAVVSQSDAETARNLLLESGIQASIVGEIVADTKSEVRVANVSRLTS